MDQVFSVGLKRRESRLQVLNEKNNFYILSISRRGFMSPIDRKPNVEFYKGKPFEMSPYDTRPLNIFFGFRKFLEGVTSPWGVL